MGDEENPFRFLADADFLALNADARMKYLLRASEELEARRKRLVEQTQEHIKTQQNGKK